MRSLSVPDLWPKVYSEYSVVKGVEINEDYRLKKKLPKWLRIPGHSKAVASGVLFLFTLWSGFMLYELLQIKTHYSMDQFHPDNHALLKTDKRIKARFQIVDALPYLILVESKTQRAWTEPRMLAELTKLTQKISAFDEVSDIKSLANIETAVTDDRSFTVGRIRDIASTPAHQKKILKDPLMAPQLVSNDGKFAALVIKTNSLSFKQQSTFIKKLKNVVSEKPNLFAGEIGGPSAISSQIAELLSDEITIYSILSLLISILIFYVMFQNISVVLIGSLVILCSNLAALGAMSLFGFSLTVLSSTVPILVTIMVVSITTQTLSRISDLRNKVLKRHHYILSLRVMRELIAPHFIGAITTAVGFATFASSEIPIIREYGLSVTVGILVGCATTILLLPALLTWLPAPQKRKEIVNWPVISRKVIQYKKPLFASVMVLVLVCIAIGGRLNWSTVIFDDLPESHATRRATETAQMQLGGVIPLEISVGRSSAKEFWKNPKNLQKMDKLIARWRDYEGVGSVVGVADFLKAASPQQTISKNKKSISETFFIYGMAEENPLQNFTADNNSFARVSIRMHDIPSHENQRVIQRMLDDARRTFPTLKVEATGMAATLHTMNEELSRSLIYDFYSALMWIVLLLMVILRSVRWTVIAVIPNLVPTALLLGVLAISQTPIKPGVAMVFAISLGMAFNNTIYILDKLKKMIKGSNAKTLPIESLMAEEFGPCFVSSIAVMAGFVVFLFSYFSMNKLFGTYLMLSVVTGLIGDLILLPTLLALFPGLLLAPIRGDRILFKVRSFMMLPAVQKLSIALIIGASILFFAKPSFAVTPNEEALAVLKKVVKKQSSPYEEAEIKMITHEPDGSSKERRILIKRKNDKENKALVKLLSPSDLKGVGFLSLNTGSKSEEQWLYLPSEKRSRRIVGSNKKGKFLDSELSYEDFRVSTYEDFESKIIEKSKDTYVIESTSKEDDGIYDKIKTWIDIKNYRILKSEYYSHDGKLVKEMSFNNYKKYKNLWRAQNVSVKNLKKNRSTTLEIQKLSAKKMSDSEFSMSALEAG